VYDKYWDSLTESLWSPESWFKVLFLLAFSPVWFPVIKSMWREVTEVLAPEGGLYANKTPRPIARRPIGDDPFLNIPLASHRRRQASARSSGSVERSARSAHDVNRGSRTPRARGF